MSVLQKEIRKCKHDDCVIPTSTRKNVNYRFCVYYVKEFDGCTY